MKKISEEYQRYQQSQLMRELASSAHREEYRGQTSSATYSEIKSKLQEMHLCSESRILDAGCGNGAFSIPIAYEFPFLVDGIDIGGELTKEATHLASQANLSSKCHFFAGDFSDSSVYPSHIYDAIICIGSLYWGQDLPNILKIWRSVTHSGSQLLIFLNMEYTPLTLTEKEAIGGTQFLSALTVQNELSKHKWALSEWSDATNLYIVWLQRWCHRMEELSIDISLEMGEDKATQLSNRFKTYLLLAQKQAVRRIILRATHV